MKNQYFGDINDYRKYGLLRALAKAGLSIGVCWMLTGDDGSRDGEMRAYLTQPGRWRGYDPGLYDCLRRLQQPGAARRVRNANKWDLVPGATYVSKLLRDGRDAHEAVLGEAFNAIQAAWYGEIEIRCDYR